MRTPRVASSCQSSSSQSSCARRHASHNQRRSASPPGRQNARSALREGSDGRREPLGEPRHERVQERVGRARRRHPGGPARGLGDLPLVRPGAEAPGEHRRRRSPRGTSRGPSWRPADRAAVAASSSSGGASRPRRLAKTISARQPLQPRALELVDRPELGGGQQVGRGCGVGHVELRLRRGERALDPRRAGPASARPPARRNAAAAAIPPRALGPVGRARHLRGHGLVGRRRRMRAVPGAAVGIRAPGRSRPRVPGARCGGRPDPPRGRAPSERADAGSARSRRARSARRPRPAARPRGRSRDARRHATAGSGRPAARPPPPGAERCVSRGSARARWT